MSYVIDFRDRRIIGAERHEKLRNPSKELLWQGTTERLFLRLEKVNQLWMHLLSFQSNVLISDELPVGLDQFMNGHPTLSLLEKSLLWG